MSRDLCLRAAGARPSRAALLLLLLASTPAAAGAQEGLMLGRLALGHEPPGEPLRIRVGHDSFTSAGFLRRVGGVAFLETARPAAALAGQPVRLAYDETQPDGSRLAVSVGGRVYRPRLPDWELVPIARYAVSDYNAAVSLFGEGSTGSRYAPVYHPALANTLLGLRLLQADMLLMLEEANAVQLPREGAAVLLGAGEAVPDASAAYHAHALIFDGLRGQNPHSWVLTDRGETVRFGVEDGAFSITGEPYYYFWDLSPRLAALEDSLELVVRRYNETVDVYNAQLARMQGRAPKQAERQQLQAAGGRLRADSAIVARLKREIERAETLPAAAATSALRKRQHQVEAYNPAVYDAARQTMRYAAFFRYVRAADPAGWAEFERRLRDVPVHPAVRTPSRVPRTQPADAAPPGRGSTAGALAESARRP